MLAPPIMASVAPLILLMVFTVLATAQKFSTINTVANHLTASAQTDVTFFQGSLYCELGCNKDDTFSFIGGLTTQPDPNFTIQSIDILFYDEETNAVLVTLPAGKSKINIPVVDNAFDEVNIPWTTPIPADTIVTFRGTVNYRFTPRVVFFDTSRFSYIPADPAAAPQNLFFETRFSAKGAVFTYVDGLWAKDFSTTGKFAFSADDIATDIHAVQIKIVGGYTWTTAESRGCDINAQAAYSMRLDDNNTVMTFVPQQRIYKGMDLSIYCFGDILKPKSSQITTLKQTTYAEIRFITPDEPIFLGTNGQDNLTNNQAKYVYTRQFWSVIEQDPPIISASAHVYGDALVCSYTYKYQTILIPANKDESFQLHVASTVTGGITPQNALARITNEEDQTSIYQRSNWSIEKNGKFSRLPINLDLSSRVSPDPLRAAQLWVSVPLSSGTDGAVKGQVTCRVDYYHPNQQDAQFVFPSVISAVKYEKAAEFVMFDRIRTAPTHFSVTAAKLLSAVNYFSLQTTTFDSLFHGDRSTCYAELVLYVPATDSDEAHFTPTGQKTPTTSTDPSPVNGLPSFTLNFNDKPLAAGESYTLHCPDMTYIPIKAAAGKKNPAETATTMVVVKLAMVDPDSEQADAIIRANAALVRPITKETSSPSTKYLLIGILFAAIIITVIVFFAYRYYTNKRKASDDILQHQLLYEDDNHLVIQ